MEKNRQKKEVTKDEAWLREHSPYIIRGSRCIFRFDDMNWAVAYWNTEEKKIPKHRNLAFYGSIELAIKRFTEDAAVDETSKKDPELLGYLDRLLALQRDIVRALGLKITQEDR